MIKEPNILIVIPSAISLSSQVSFASAVYPAHLQLRSFGNSQGNAGSCAAEAETTALESMFAERGYPVELSSYYVHDYNWKANTAAERARTKLPPLTEADRQILERYGPIVPKFMFPEDGTGVNNYYTGIRPNISEAGLFDPGFPDATSLGYTKVFKTFSILPDGKPFANTANLEDLKLAVSQKRAVTLTIHADILEKMMNEKTGLLNSGYSKERISTLAAESHQRDSARPELNMSGSHAVAVLGYDDSLYSDRGFPISGAFIVKNSWNDWSRIKLAGEQPSPAEIADLSKMRLKVYSKNLPGIYAIPYAYILDLIAPPAHDSAKLGVGGFTITEIDYAAYAQAFALSKASYKTVGLPFGCDTRIKYGSEEILLSQGARQSLKSYQQLIGFMANADASVLPAVRSNLQSLVARNAGMREQPYFNVAFVPTTTSNTNLIKSFYDGKISAYYCEANETTIPDANIPTSGRANGSIWPKYHTYEENADFRVALATLADDYRGLGRWNRIYKALASTSLADEAP